MLDRQFKYYAENVTYYGYWVDDDPEIGVSSKEFNEFMEEFEIKRGD